MTKDEMLVLQHTVGYPEMNRNHFATGGDDHPDFATLESLVEKGFMKKRKKAEWMGGGWIFHATCAGKMRLNNG
jgi:hypothetical protein